MKNFLDKVRALLGKVGEQSSTGSGGKVATFLGKYWRYLSVAVLIALLALLLCQCTGKSDNVAEPEDNTEEATEEIFELDMNFEEDAYAEVNQLVSDYFSAYASGEQNVIEHLARPISDNEKSYISVYSQYIESYQNIKCYTKSGLTDGAYLVSAYYNIKFYGIDTLAPGLEFFYVETDEDGQLYINNLYGSYNRIRMENEMDSNIYYLILQFEQQEDSAALRQEVEAEYNEALASDVNLATLISTTIPAAVNNWVEQMNALNQSNGQNVAENVESTEETEEPEEEINGQDPGDDQQEEQQNPTDDEQTEQPGEQTADTTNQDEQQEQQTVTVRVITGSVNVRVGPSTDTNSYGKALEGQTFTKLGESGDWTEVDYDGSKAYIKTEFLEIE